MLPVTIGHQSIDILSIIIFKLFLTFRPYQLFIDLVLTTGSDLLQRVLRNFLNKKIKNTYVFPHLWAF